MEAVYNSVPETNRVTVVYSVAAIPQLYLMVHVTLFPMLFVLYFYISTYPNMCPVSITTAFCSFLIVIGISNCVAFLSLH